MDILLHICCGPCSLYPIDDLKENIKPDDESLNIRGLFYNPNIHPLDEQERRRQGAIEAARHKGIVLDIKDDFNQVKWEEFGGEESERCAMCYTERLSYTAKHAAENDIRYFTTSLLVSPYQKHELICKIAEEMATKYGVKFLYRDFRSGFRKGQNQAWELGIYRQKYCGCIISKP